MARWDASIKYSGTLWSEPNVTAEVREAMSEVRGFAEQLIQSRTPVDTGKMKSSWQVNTSDRLLTISNPMYYANFIEEGTRKIKPFYCYTGALPAIEQRFKELVIEKIEAKYGGNTRSLRNVASMLVGAKRGLIYQKRKATQKLT